MTVRGQECKQPQLSAGEAFKTKVSGMDRWNALQWQKFVLNLQLHILQSSEIDRWNALQWRKESQKSLLKLAASHTSKL